jgi:hypothetical protein
MVAVTMALTTRGARVGLILAAVAGRLLVSLVGPAAADLDPYHTHVTVGGTPRQQAEALARHRHDHVQDAAPDHDHEVAAVQVLSITAGPPAGVLVVGLTGVAAATVTGIEVAAPKPSDAIAVPAPFFPTSLPRTVPEPPPRAT